jgi:hypothetical protein
MEIGPVQAELFHADGPTDWQKRQKLTAAFRNFANAPKTCDISSILGYDAVSIGKKRKAFIF